MSYKLYKWIAYKLPDKIALWATIRVISEIGKDKTEKFLIERLSELYKRAIFKGAKEEVKDAEDKN